MKSLILVNSGEAGGAEKVVSLLSNNLPEHEVGLVFIKDKIFHEFNSKMKKFVLHNHQSSNSLIYLALELKKIVKENNILTVQSHMYRSNYINVLAKLFGSTHTVQIVNCDCVSSKYTCGYKATLSKILIFLLYRFSDITITKSKAMLEDLKKYTKIKNGIVIYNPIDLTKIKKMRMLASPHFDRKDYSFNKLLVNVGRFHEQKRQKDLIISLSKLDSSYGLVLIGDGEEVDTCKNIARELGVSNRVIFTGKVKNPFSILKQCDLFIMSSSCEGFPNALVEAMACGLPIISSDHLSGAKEILSNSENVLDLKKEHEAFSCEEFGLLYPVGNTEELTGAINFIFDNNKIDFYKERSLLRVVDYDLENSISIYKKLIT